LIIKSLIRELRMAGMGNQDNLPDVPPPQEA
jgi:hypothetical protein